MYQTRLVKIQTLRKVLEKNARTDRSRVEVPARFWIPMAFTAEQKRALRAKRKQQREADDALRGVNEADGY